MLRPVLAPGLRVLQHARGQLQIGLDPERRLLLPDTEPVRRTLGHLLRGEAVPDDLETRSALETLSPVLVDGHTLLAPDVDAGDVAAAALLDPASYAERLAARRRASISITGSLGSVDPRPLLAAAGVTVSTEPTHVLVLSEGEIDRAALDVLVRHRTVHLVVRVVEGNALVGPLVVPGHTACLRCLDAHSAVFDPRAETLANRHAQARGDRRDGVCEPVDTALATLAVAWAVRDLVTHIEGERPSTWSATIRLAAGLRSVTQTEWLRHPACGCSWLPEDHLSRTMGV